ncbi:hypothetical protein D9M72_313800 [compost metagenome]
MAASSSLTTFFMRMRLEWKVKRSGRICWRASSIAGISVSMVVFELGTIWPMRKTFCMRVLGLYGYSLSRRCALPWQTSARVVSSSGASSMNFAATSVDS